MAKTAKRSAGRAAARMPPWSAAPWPSRKERRVAVAVGAWLRRTRSKVGFSGSLRQILFGPAGADDGSHNLVGAVITRTGNVGVAR